MMCFRTPAPAGPRRRTALSALLAMTLVATVSPAAGQRAGPDHGRVRVHSGDLWTGRFLGLAGDTLVLTLEGEGQVRLPSGGVSRFERRVTAEPVRSTVMGSVLGLIGLIILENTGSVEVTERWGLGGIGVGALGGFVRGRSAMWRAVPTPRPLDLGDPLGAGRRVRITAHAQPVLQGTVIGWDPSTIVLEANDGSRHVVPVRSILTLSEPAPSNRRRPGALLGFVAGTALGVVSFGDSRLSFTDNAAYVLMSGVGGAVAGGIAGSRIPAPGWRLTPFARPIPAVVH